LYTIKWTGLQPTETGWSRSSDTNNIRLFQTNLLGEDVERGSTGRSYFQVIREDTDPLDLVACGRRQASTHRTVDRRSHPKPKA
jgi:hypothetical protein